MPAVYGSRGGAGKTIAPGSVLKRAKSGRYPTASAGQLAGAVSDEVYAEASAEVSEKELIYLTSAIAVINA